MGRSTQHSRVNLNVTLKGTASNEGRSCPDKDIGLKRWGGAGEEIRCAGFYGGFTCC